jgi:thioredoxin reductase (NADPH)
MPRPLLLAVDADPETLSRIEMHLQRRFGGDFRIRGELTAAAALAQLEAARDRHDPVVTVLADQWLPDLPGAELLARVRTMHPDARRALLVPWGAWSDRPTAEAILRAMALGDINYYVLKPWSEHDELFNRTIGEFVHEWSRTVTSPEREVVVIAERRAARGHGIRSLLTRNGIPHTFLERGSADATAALAQIGIRAPEELTGPVVVWMPALGGTPRSARPGGSRRRCRTRSATSTCSSSGPALQGWPRRSTRPRRACGCSSSSVSRSAARRARAR